MNIVRKVGAMYILRFYLSDSVINNKLIVSDIDECETKGGRTGNHCQRNTRCVNKLGSYTCECLPGYVRKDALNCVGTF